MAVEKKKQNRQSLVKVEGNLSEYPFFSLAKSRQREQVKIFTFEARIREDGSVEERSLKLEAPPSYSLPSAFDMDVLMAISYIGTRDQSLNDEIHFSLYEVAKLLGLEASKRTHIIKESILKMVAVFCHAHHTVIVKDGERSRFLKKEEAFHIIESSGFLDIEDSESTCREARQHTYIRFNKYFIKNFLSGYFQFVDFQNYLSLDTPTAKRLYVYLSKKRSNRPFFRISIDKLSNVIPIEAKRKTKIRQLIKDASTRLVEQGLLDNFILNWGDQYVTFCFGESRKPLGEQLSIDGLLEEEVVSDGDNDLIAALIEQNVALNVASQLVSTYSRERIEQQLAWLPYRKAENPAAFLVSAIKQEWSKPMELVTQEEVSEQQTEDEAYKIRILEIYKKAKASSHVVMKNGRYPIGSVNHNAIEIIYSETDTRMLPIHMAMNCQFE